MPAEQSQLIEQLRWTEAHIVAFGMLIFAFFTLALTMGEIPRCLKFLLYTAEHWLATGQRHEEATGLVRFVLDQPQLAAWARVMAERLVGAAEAPEQLAATSSRAARYGTRAADDSGASGASGKARPGVRQPPPGSPSFEEAVGTVLAFAAGA